MDITNNPIIKWCTAIAVLAAFVGTVYTVDAHFAKSAEVEYVSSKVDRHLLEERIEYLQKKIWKTEDVWTERYYKQTGEYPENNEVLVAFMSEEARDIYREDIKELEKLEKELEAITVKKE